MQKHEQPEKTYDLPDARGHFGPYGGSFVSETLVHALDELKAVRAAVGTAFSDAKDIDGWNSFKAVYIDCRAVLEGGAT